MEVGEGEGAGEWGVRKMVCGGGRGTAVCLFSVCQLLWKTAKTNEIQQAFGVAVSQGEARLLKGSVEFRLKVSCVFGLGQSLNFPQENVSSQKHAAADP